MKRRDIVIGIVILVLLSLILWWRQRNNNSEAQTVVPQTLSTEENLEEKFKIEIPEDGDKAELKDVSGGNSSGIVIKNSGDNSVKNSVIADLPKPEGSGFYHVWAEKDGEDPLLIGTLRSSKGGWTLDNTSLDLGEYNKFKVTLEERSDKTPEKTILEGSF